MGNLSAVLAALRAARKIGPLMKELWPLLTAIVAVIASHLAGVELTPAESAGAVVAGGAMTYHFNAVKRLKALIRPRRV